MLLIIGIVLTVVGLAYLCWLLFTLAVYALPVFVGASAALAAYDSGSAPIAAFIVGLIGSGITLVAAQFVITRARSPFLRAAVSLVFAVPAALAGYYATRPRATRHPGSRLATLHRGECCDCCWRDGVDPFRTDCPAQCGVGLAAGFRCSPDVLRLLMANLAVRVSGIAPRAPKSGSLTSIMIAMSSEASTEKGGPGRRRRTLTCDVGPGSGSSAWQRPCARWSFSFFAPGDRHLVRAMISATLLLDCCRACDLRGL